MKIKEILDYIKKIANECYKIEYNDINSIDIATEEIDVYYSYDNGKVLILPFSYIDKTIDEIKNIIQIEEKEIKYKRMKSDLERDIKNAKESIKYFNEQLENIDKSVEFWKTKKEEWIALLRKYEQQIDELDKKYAE
jgi:predicted RNase H-like nuclease (RuvC/YqgF family)